MLILKRHKQSFSFQANTLKNHSKLILIFMILMIFCGCQAYTHGFQTNAFKKVGWLRVIKHDPRKNSAFFRIKVEMDIRKEIKEHIQKYGYPDYYRCYDNDDVYYAYVKDLSIYHFEHSIFSLKKYEKIHYKDMIKLLPHEIIDDFKNNDPIVLKARKELKKKREQERLEAEKKKDKEKKIVKKEPSAKIISTGTGFFIGERGYLLTNYHVIKKADSVKIYSNNKIYPTEIITVDPVNDIVLLKVNKTTEPVSINTSKINKGAQIAVFGYPLIGLQGNELKSTFGHINALSGGHGDFRYYQIDAPMQPGNSGGPVVDYYGNIIGIVTATLSQRATIEKADTLNQNVNYAIKIDYAMPMLKQHNVRYLAMRQKHKMSSEKLVQQIENKVVVVISEKEE